MKGEVPAEHGRCAGAVQPRQGGHSSERFPRCRCPGAAFGSAGGGGQAFPAGCAAETEPCVLMDSPGFQNGDGDREGVQALGPVFLKAD